MNINSGNIGENLPEINPYLIKKKENTSKVSFLKENIKGRYRIFSFNA